MRKSSTPILASSLLRFLSSRPALAGRGDRALARWAGRLTRRFSCNAKFSSPPAPPPPRFATADVLRGRFALDRRPQVPPVPPSPAMTGMDGLVLPFSRHGLRARDRTKALKVSPDARRARWLPFKFPLDWQEAKKGKRNADRRWVTTSAPFYRRGDAPLSLSPRPLARVRVGGGTPAYRRSTAALTRGTLVPKAQLQARLPGTWFPRVLPAVSCPSPVDAPHTPAIVPASMMPGPARERSVAKCLLEAMAHSMIIIFSLDDSDRYTRFLIKDVIGKFAFLLVAACNVTTNNHRSGCERDLAANLGHLIPSGLYDGR